VPILLGDVACCEFNWRLNVCVQLVRLLYKMAVPLSGESQATLRYIERELVEARERETTSISPPPTGGGLGIAPIIFPIFWHFSRNPTKTQV